MKKILLVLLILSGSTITYAQLDSSLASLPDVTLKNVEGTDVNIADYGKKNIKLPPNERDITGKRTHITNLTSIVKALVAKVVPWIKISIFAGTKSD